MTLLSPRGALIVLTDLIYYDRGGNAGRQTAAAYLIETGEQ